MSDNNTTQKLERWQTMARDMSPGELESKRVKSDIWFLVAAFTAFFASSFFVVKYMVGGDFSPASWTGEQWGNALLGLLITAVITSFQYYLYSIDQKTTAAILGALIAVFFGLFSEISQSMEREDATVRHRSESSPVFQAALNKLESLGNSNGGEGYAALIAAARAEKAQAETALTNCQTRYKGDLSRNKCKREQQEAIASAQAKIDSYNDAGNTARADRAESDKAFITQLQGMQYDETQHYAMIRLIKEWLGIVGIWASFWFSFIIIGTFEYAFHFIGGYLNDVKKALRALGYETGIFKKQPARSSIGDPAPGMAATVAALADSADSADSASHAANQPKYLLNSRWASCQTPDMPSSAPLTAFTGAADSARQTVADYAGRAEQAIRNAPEAIATDMMQAQAARERLHQTMVDGFDMSRIGKQFAPTDAELETGRTYRAAIRAGSTHWQDTALDAPTPPAPEPDLPTEPDLNNLTGQVGQVKNRPDLNLLGQVKNYPDLTLKVTELEQKIVAQEAEKVRLQQQAEADLKRLEADRERAEAHAQEQAEAKRRADQAAIEAERRHAAEQAEKVRLQQQAEADLKAAEAEKVRLQQQAEADLKRAAAEAEKVRLQQQAEADRKAELGELTEEQVRLAAEAIRAAIVSGQVGTLGRATLKPVLAAADLPRSTEAVKVLIKWGCTDLINTGLVARNPEPGNGKPEFVILA